MRLFGLTPDDVWARGLAAQNRPVPSRAFSIGYGAGSFAAVSVLAYSIWAFQLIPGTAAMYSTIAAVYVGLTGLALSRLVLGPGAAARFSLLFATVFLAYAVVWCVFWFGLKGKYHADLYGSAVGLALMTDLLRRAFGKDDDFLPLFGVLFMCHSLGYYLGGECHVLVPGPVGKLLWGAAHGFGFGAGLGYVVFNCQSPLKARLTVT